MASHGSDGRSRAGAAALTVHKFGGVALADAAAMRHAAAIIAARRDTRSVVVVSAMAGVTDELLRIGRMAVERDEAGHGTELHEAIERLERRHLEAVAALSLDEVARAELHAIVREAHEELLRCCE